MTDTPGSVSSRWRTKLLPMKPQPPVISNGAMRVLSRQEGGLARSDGLLAGSVRGVAANILRLARECQVRPGKGRMPRATGGHGDYRKKARPQQRAGATAAPAQTVTCAAAVAANASSRSFIAVSICRAVMHSGGQKRTAFS